jgi:DNA repair exonuclease SbcCD ATPase subunit
MHKLQSIPGKRPESGSRQIFNKAVPEYSCKTPRLEPIASAETMGASNSASQQLTVSGAADNSAGTPENNELESELQDTIQHVKFILNYLGDYEQKQAVASYVYMNLEGIKVKGGEDYYHKVLEEQFSSEEKEKLKELKPHLEEAMREREESFEELYQSLKGVIKDKLEKMITESEEGARQEREEAQKFREEAQRERQEAQKERKEKEKLWEQIRERFHKYCEELEKIKSLAKQYKNEAHNAQTKAERALSQIHLNRLKELVDKYYWQNDDIFEDEELQLPEITEEEFELTPIGEEGE